MGKPRYIDQYIDNGLEPEPVFTVEELDGLTEKHCERLAREIALGNLVLAHKRRLGHDATPRELAADRSFAKRYRYGAENLLESWNVSPKRIRELVKAAERTETTKIAAAQVNWHEHIVNLCAYLRHEMRFVATNANYHNLVKEGSKLILRLENELLLQAQRYEKVFGNPINPQEIPEYSQEVAQTPEKS